MVAGFLSSWEYLLIRSNKLKTKNETLAASLLKEVTSVLKQIRSLSQCLLKPYVENKENIANKFIVSTYLLSFAISYFFNFEFSF